MSLVIQLHSHTAKLGSRLHRFVWSSTSYVFANCNNHNEYLFNICNATANTAILDIAIVKLKFVLTV